jgi:hypothetical protein
MEWMQCFESRINEKDVCDREMDEYEFPLSEGSNEFEMSDDEKEEKIITNKKLLSNSKNNEVIHLKINKFNKDKVEYSINWESKNNKDQKVRLKAENNFDENNQDAEMLVECSNPIIDLTNYPTKPHQMRMNNFYKAKNDSKEFDYTIQGESEAIEIKKPRTIDLKKVDFF